MDLTWYDVYLSHYSISYKIIVIGFIICTTLMISGWLIEKKTRILWNIADISWLALWGYVTVALTLFGRWKTENPEAKFQLFWCIREAWANRSIIDWYFIVGNIALFIPLGIILTMFFERMQAAWKVLLVGFMCSLIIELTQLVKHIGLFELDDLFHNTLGAYLGYCLCVMILFAYKREWRTERKKSFVISCVSWLVVVAFFGVAVAMGQPVFGWMHPWFWEYVV